MIGGSSFFLFGFLGFLFTDEFDDPGLINLVTIKCAVEIEKAIMRNHYSTGRFAFVSPFVRARHSIVLIRPVQKSFNSHYQSQRDRAVSQTKRARFSALLFNFEGCFFGSDSGVKGVFECPTKPWIIEG